MKLKVNKITKGINFIYLLFVGQTLEKLFQHCGTRTFHHQTNITNKTFHVIPRNKNKLDIVILPHWKWRQWRCSCFIQRWCQYWCCVGLFIIVSSCFVVVATVVRTVSRIEVQCKNWIYYLSMRLSICISFIVPLSWNWKEFQSSYLALEMSYLRYPPPASSTFKMKLEPRAHHHRLFQCHHFININISIDNTPTPSNGK